MLEKDAMMELDKIEKGLRNVIQMSSNMRLDESAEAFRLLLRKYERHDTIDKQLLYDAEYLLRFEFCDKDTSYKHSFEIFKTILDGVYKKRARTGRKTHLLSDEAGRLDSLDKSLGILFGEMKKKPQKKTAMLLLCLGHVIRYEAFAASGGFLRKRLIELINIGLRMTKKERDQLIEDFLTIRGKGKDGKADTTHIRNSIAHGRFEFIADNIIRFENVDKKGNTLFESQLNDGDILGLFNMFEMKLRFMLLYSLLIYLWRDIRDHEKSI
ncbi:MAG: hypothetical protein KAR39_05375 [Thermoplasmata archaeon]|nr:hypothetical protein [Thermoplasmata archaeon]